MKKPIQDIEQALRTRLEHFESEVPDSMFEQMMTTRNMRHSLNAHSEPVSDTIFEAVVANRAYARRRRLLFAAGAATLALMSLVGAWYMVGTDKKVETPLVPTPKIENLPTTTATVQNNVALATPSVLSETAAPTVFKQEHTKEKHKNTIFINRNVAQTAIAQAATQSIPNINAPDKAVTITNDERIGDAGVIFQNCPQGSSAPVLPFLPIKSLVFALEKGSIGPDRCPSFKGKHRGSSSFYLDAFVAPEYASRKLSTTTDANALLTARDTAEKTQYALSTGIRASFDFGNAWILRGGLAYAQINEKAMFDSVGVIRVIRTEEIVRNPNGTVDTLRKVTTDEGIFRSNRFNRYRQIDIPITLGYEMPISEHWHIAPHLGVWFNIVSWRKADIVNPSLTTKKPYNASSGIGDDNAVFRNSVGITAVGSVAFLRTINEHSSFFVEPTVRYYLRPHTQANFAVQQRYTTFGLATGIRWKF